MGGSSEVDFGASPRIPDNRRLDHLKREKILDG